eukprot:scaffold1766_cov401-Prasinococcus_capsulatus_cf.AAC.14
MQWLLSGSNKCNQANQMGFSNCGDHLYHPSGSVVHVYGTYRGFRQKELVAHLARVNCVEVHRESDALYTAGQDAQILVWAPKQSQPHEEDGDGDAWSDDDL